MSKAPSLRHAVLLTALGPNPAPLIEVVWGLASLRSLLVTDAVVALDHSGDRYLRYELLGGESVLSELHAALGEASLDESRLRLRVAQRHDGTRLRDDADEGDAQAYHEALFRAAREAIAIAGDKPVVFALAAGRRRTMTAALTSTFQLLSRRHDLCVDVRVSDRRVEGGTGFYFPAQARQRVETDHGDVQASSVRVELVDVPLPRLRGLLAGNEPTSFADALAATQAAIDLAEPPTMCIDLHKGQLAVDGVHWPVKAARLVWMTTLALARQRGDGWVAASSPLLAHVAAACAPLPWATSVRCNPVRELMGLPTPASYRPDDEGLELRKLRADTRALVETLAAKHCPRHASLLVPETRRTREHGALTHAQRIALPAGRISIEPPLAPP